MDTKQPNASTSGHPVLPPQVEAFIKFMQSVGASVSVHAVDIETCGDCQDCHKGAGQESPKESASPAASEAPSVEKFASDLFAEVNQAFKADVDRIRTAKKEVRAYVATLLKRRIRDIQHEAAEAEYAGSMQEVLDNLQAQLQELRTLHALFAVSVKEAQVQA